MEDKDEIEKLANQYPQYKDLIRDARYRTRTIDQRIEQLREDQPTPTLKPNEPAGLSARVPGSKARAKGDLEAQKAEIHKEFQGEIEKDLEGKSPEVQQKTRKDVAKIYSSKGTLSFDRKDMDVSQEFSAAKTGKEKSIAGQLLDHTNSSRSARREIKENSKSITKDSREIE